MTVRFHYMFFLRKILLKTNCNEQLTPDDPFEKYCLEYVFYEFASKIADAIVTFKVINICILFSTFTSNVYPTAAK